MTATALVGMFALAIFGIGISIYNILRFSGEHRADIIYVAGLAIRYTYWVGMDAAHLRHALGIAVGCLTHVWPAAMVCVALDGIHFDLSGDTWTDADVRVPPTPAMHPYTRIALVDVRLRFLAHELAHLVEEHSGASRGLRRDAHHRWRERGVYEALKSYEVSLKQLEEQ